MPPTSSSKTARNTEWIAGILLVLLVLAVYVVSLRGQFLWDDDAHITKNACIIGPLGLKEVWSTAAADYFPLVLTNFWVQHALWGLNPIGYHVVTVICHALAALGLWRVLAKLQVPAGWLGAALWALHPVNVESVAWICELKNTQSGVFFMLAMWFFVRWLGKYGDTVAPRTAVKAAADWDYGLAAIMAVLAILSKPSAVMLPVVLLLCAWWKQRRFRLGIMAVLVPFFALSALASGWTIWEQKFHSKALGPEWNQGLAERFLIAARVPWFYLKSLLWPDSLAFIYPRWALVGVVSAYALLILTALVFIVIALKRRAHPVLFVTSGCFIALLFPVLGFFDVYFFRYSFVSDHFQYLASAVPIAVVAALITKLTRHWVIIGSTMVASLVALSIRQEAVFHHNEVLWTTSITRSPTSTLPLTQLGAIYGLRGNHSVAAQYFSRAIELNANDYYAHNGLGCELLAAGEWNRAIIELEQATRLDPTNSDAHNNLGFALYKTGRMQDARRQFEQALKLRPDYPDAHINLGNLLSDIGEHADAIRHFTTALQKDPANAGAHHDLGLAYERMGNRPSAITEFETAVRLKRQAESYDDLGATLLLSGQTEEAITRLQQAVVLAPAMNSAREHLGQALVAHGTELAAAGKLDEALREFERAIAAQPSLSLAHLNRGSALANLGRWAEARDEFSRAVELDPSSAAGERLLGIALATTGDLRGSVSHFERSLQLEPNARETHETYSRVLEKLGRSTEARQQADQAAALPK